ncbi:MAG TPA: TPM domain-containing protein [Polyangia bacterium]|nr:TPM domain-containing protein [Polyangia bacterium]
MTDRAGFLAQATVADLDGKLDAYARATGHQVLVYIDHTTGGVPIEDWAVKAFEHWRVGRKGIDDGLVLFVFSDDHRVRIEVGYGLEPVMTDAMSSIIIRNAILPKFKAGDFDGGVEAGTDAIIQQLSLDRGVAIQKAQAAAQQTDDSGAGHRLPFPVIILIIIFIFLFSRGWLPWFLLGSIFGGGGRGGGWGGGSDGGGWSGGGGGGFSGGGGGFGGGGASGGW